MVMSIGCRQHIAWQVQIRLLSIVSWRLCPSGHISAQLQHYYYYQSMDSPGWYHCGAVTAACNANIQAVSMQAWCLLSRLLLLRLPWKVPPYSASLLPSGKSLALCNAERVNERPF